MAGFHQPAAPATTPGPTSFHQPAAPAGAPPADACPLCHPRDTWPPTWQAAGWRPPRQQMCERHLPDLDGLLKIDEWNRQVEAAARQQADEQADREAGWRQPTDDGVEDDGGMF